nr:10585_t:CDS:2 [Entrophospora candida]
MAINNKQKHPIQSQIELDNMQNEDEEELGAPVNIYHEHRSHLEQDKKARIELDTHMLKDELYDPISTSDLNTTNATINNMNSNNMLWGYYKNDLFYLKNDNINGVSCL